MTKFFFKKKYNLVLRYLDTIENSGFYLNKKLYDNNLRFDKAFKSIKNELYKYRLVIHENFSSTAYLETLNFDFPSIIFIEKKNEIYLSKSFKKNFDLMVKAKIVHTNIRKLEKFLDKNINNISGWWNSKEVRYAIEKFKKNYLNTKKNTNKEIYNLINQIV